MPIKVQCPEPGCGYVLTVRDDFAGKKGRCPKCGGVIPVPADANGSGPDEDRVSASSRDNRDYEVVDDNDADDEDRDRSSVRDRPRSRRDEDDDRDSRARRRDRDDDDDRDSRARRRDRDDEDDDDRGSRARRRDRDDDDEDDRGSRSRRRDRDDEDDDDDRDFRRGRKRKASALTTREGYRRAHLGMSLILFHLYVFIGALVIEFLAGLVFGIGMSSALSNKNPTTGVSGMIAAGTLSTLIGYLAKLLMVISWGLWIGGLAFCCFIPPERGARVLAIVAVSVAGLGALLELMGIGIGVLPGLNALAALAALGNYGANFFWFVSAIVFMFCMRSIAQNLKDGELAKQLLVLVIVWGASIVVIAILYLLWAYVVVAVIWGSRGGEGTMAGLGCATLVFGLIILAIILIEFIWYIILINRTRQLSADRLGL